MPPKPTDVRVVGAEEVTGGWPKIGGVPRVAAYLSDVLGAPLALVGNLLGIAAKLVDQTGAARPIRFGAEGHPEVSAYLANTLGLPLSLIGNVLEVAAKLVDTDGNIRPIRFHFSGHPEIVAYDPGELAADESSETNHVVRVLGVNPRVASDRSKQTIWPWAGASTQIGSDVYAGDHVLPLPATPMTLYLRSTSPDDHATGPGARRVHISYLDGNYESRSVSVIPDGCGPVLAITDFFRVNRMRMDDAGALNSPAGDVLLVDTPAGNGSVYYGIMRGRQISFCGSYTVPKGTRLHVTRWTCTSIGTFLANDRYCFIVFATKSTTRQQPLKYFIAHDLAYLSTGTYNADFRPALPIPEKTDIRLTSEVDDNARISGSVWGYLEPL